MKVCVPTIGICGTGARNYGIGANYFLFFTVNGSVGVKLQENASYNIITHIDDLKEIFLEEDFTIRQGIFSNNLTSWVTLNSEVSDQRPRAKDKKPS